MTEDWPEMVFGGALLLLAGLTWLAMLRRWRDASGAAVALICSAPLIWLALAGMFRLGALIMAAAGLLGGVAIALSGRR